MLMSSKTVAFCVGYGVTMAIALVLVRLRTGFEERKRQSSKDSTDKDDKPTFRKNLSYLRSQGSGGQLARSAPSSPRMTRPLSQVSLTACEYEFLSIYLYMLSPSPLSVQLAVSACNRSSTSNAYRIAVSNQSLNCSDSHSTACVSANMCIRQACQYESCSGYSLSSACNCALPTAGESARHTGRATSSKAEQEARALDNE
jgi:hypothetical protein